MSTAFIGVCSFLFGISLGIVIGTAMEIWNVRRGQRGALRIQSGIDVDKLTAQQRHELLD
jgi:hypothetical protein